MVSLERRGLREGFENLSHGSHVCCIYSGVEERFSMLPAFVQVGLERDEKCLYVFDESTKSEIIDRFGKSGIEMDRLLETGQFEFLTKRESYLRGGRFDPDEMFELIEEAKDKALNQGYTGLRAMGEMTWVFTDMPGVERLMEYESKLNSFIESQEMTILCQYNERRFSPEKLLDVIHTHPKIVIDNYLYENHYYMPVETFTAMVKGEVDEDYYRKIKNNLKKEAKPAGAERKPEKGEKNLRNILRTLEKLEKPTA